MRHGKKTAKLGLGRSHRKAMMGNMAASLFEHEVVTTTKARARALRSTAESLITFAKRGDLHARRQVLRVIANKAVVKKLFDDIGPRFTERPGGYTRIVKTGPRRGDGAEMCLVELVERAGATVAEEPAAAEAEESKDAEA
ncbi:MAG: 50S ribosomal protein L17 [Gemmatimonadetes bacterium]|jgi:large subunit ribosomal protein L17|nr:50S ribosomal protein L17 [Gemmatimonadota bacterium]MBT7863163.1 50S ribosomal protein L17 [Gemmatimonadota bacterium]